MCLCVYVPLISYISVDNNSLSCSFCFTICHSVVCIVGLLYVLHGYILASACLWIIYPYYYVVMVTQESLTGKSGNEIFTNILPAFEASRRN